MSETRKQRKRRENAEMWANIVGGADKAMASNFKNEAQRVNRNVERRKRAQFRSQPTT